MARPSPTRRCWRASAHSQSRLRGRKCGSAAHATRACRPPGGTRADASRTAPTPTGRNSGATARSTASSRSGPPCRRGAALPRLRRRLRRDLAQPGFPRDRVLAIVVALLADTLARIGNDAYVRSNRSFGLTTLRNRHIAFLRGGRAQLRFRGKAGAEHEISLDDARLARLVRRCRQLPGQALFQYRDDDGTLQPVDSGEVNDYLRQAMGEGFSAKDFRTWGGTLEAFRALAATPVPSGPDGGEPSERALTAARNQVVQTVADRLGNTPSVCRKAYIDPVVFDGWLDGRLQRAA